MAAALILSSFLQFLNWSSGTYGGPTTMTTGGHSTQPGHVLMDSGTYGGPTP